MFSFHYNPSVTLRSEPPKLISFVSGNLCRVPPPFTQGRLLFMSVPLFLDKLEFNFSNDLLYGDIYPRENQ